MVAERQTALNGVAAAILVVLVSPAAQAGRTLSEPGPIKAVPRMVPPHKQDAALKARGVADKCSKDVLRARDLRGIACRLSIHGHLVREVPLSSEPAVQARVKAADEAGQAAKSIAEYRPLANKPGLEKRRLLAHEHACRTLLEAYDDLNAAAQKLGPGQQPAKAVLSQGKEKDRLFDRACGCAQQTVKLAGRAGADPSVSGRLQGLLTSRSCFLDKAKLKTVRGGPESEFSGRAGSVVEANTDEARLLDYAKARDIGLDRCRKKATSLGRVTDRGKLKRCVCGEVERWRFPKERGRADVDIIIPVVADKVGMRITVNAPGKVTKCGPLSGSGL